MVVLHSELQNALLQPGSLVRLSGGSLEWPLDMSLRASKQDVLHVCRQRRIIIVGTTLGHDYVEVPMGVLDERVLIIMRNHVGERRYGISLLIAWPIYVNQTKINMLWARRRCRRAQQSLSFDCACACSIQFSRKQGVHASKNISRTGVV